MFVYLFILTQGQFCIAFREDIEIETERERERERERGRAERETLMPEKHRLVALSYDKAKSTSFKKRDFIRNFCLEWRSGR